MLIVPVAEKFSWRNPPYVTIILVILNVIVFSGFQGNDNAVMDEAVKYYFENDLEKIEFQLYLKYRESIEKPLTIPEEYKKKDRQLYTFWQIERDYKFQQLLKNEKIVKSDSPDYETWKGLKPQYYIIKKGLITDNYSFVPVEHKPVTFFSYMFLHGSFGHLFGNMLFLWLFGCILEIGCGRSLYLFTYLITGLGAVILFWLTHTGSATGLVGASGAISGLMGAYTVLFGKSRIKLFLYLGFYFNYVRIPAIILLPFWLGRELYSLFSGGPGNVAYTAHIGGIIFGAIAGYILLNFSDFKKDDVFAEEVIDKSTPLVDEALISIGKLELEKGKELLEQAISENKKNYDAYTHLLNIEKQTPGEASYHAAVKKYLIALCADEDMHHKVFDVYKEYAGLAKPKLSPELYLSLSLIFTREGEIYEAEKIITMIFNKRPDLPKIPTALLKLSEGFQKSNVEDKVIKYLELLCAKYPETLEAKLALKTLQQYT